MVQWFIEVNGDRFISCACCRSCYLGHHRSYWVFRIAYRNYTTPVTNHSFSSLTGLLSRVTLCYVAKSQKGVLGDNRSRLFTGGMNANSVITVKHCDDTHCFHLFLSHKQTSGGRHVADFLMPADSFFLAPATTRPLTYYVTDVTRSVV